MFQVEDAEGFIAGYSIFNDWSARDLCRQMKMARAPYQRASEKERSQREQHGPLSSSLQMRLLIGCKNSGFDLLAMQPARVNGEVLMSDGSCVPPSIGVWQKHVGPMRSRNTWLVAGDILCTGTAWVLVVFWNQSLTARWRQISVC